MVDLIPRSFWRFPRVPSLWDEDEDMWLTTTTPSGLSISEDDKHVYVEAAVAGLDPKDVEVTFDKGVLWIKGEAKEEEEDKKKKYYRRSMQSYSYRVMVPGVLDSDVEPDVTCKNGAVNVAFTKAPKTQPKKLTVKSK